LSAKNDYRRDEQALRTFKSIGLKGYAFREVLKYEKFIRGKTSRLVNKRGDYFKYFRWERDALVYVDILQPNPKTRKGMQLCRAVYRKILPILFRKLTWDPDLIRLRLLEYRYYNDLMVGQWYRGQNPSVNRLSWFILSGDNPVGEAPTNRGNSHGGKSSNEQLSFDVIGQLRHPRSKGQSSNDNRDHPPSLG
jgi:hypothetical protein